MSAILAIESSTLTASVALLVDDTLVYHRESGVNTHSEVLLSLVDEALALAKLKLEELSTIAIGAGPGSFTGLRIGMATAKGLCFATGVSLTTVSSLAAMAMDCALESNTESILLPVLDARRGEIFAGFFRRDESGVSPISEERVLAPEDLAAFAKDTLHAESAALLLCGDGGQKYSDVLQGIGSMAAMSRHTPSAAAVARLAQHLPASKEIASATPTYVRLPEAQLKFPNGNTGGTFSQQSKTKSSPG